MEPHRYRDIARLSLKRGDVANSRVWCTQQQDVMVAGPEDAAAVGAAAAAAAAGGVDADDWMQHDGSMPDDNHQGAGMHGGYNGSTDAYAPVNRLAAAAAATAAAEEEQEAAVIEAAAAGAAAGVDVLEQPARQRDDLAAYNEHAMNLADELAKLQQLVSGFR